MSNPDWDRIAEAYSGLLTDTRQEFLFPALLSCLPGHSDLAVLDYGCGCGDFSKLLGERYHQVICFDTSEVMLKRAKEKVKGRPDHFGQWVLVAAIVVVVCRLRALDRAASAF